MAWGQGMAFSVARPTVAQAVITCTGVAVLVEAVPTGGHALAMLRQQGRPAGRAL